MPETERDRDTDFIELRETFERIIGTSVPDDALDQARRRALAVREQHGPADRAHSLALLGFATDLLVAIALEPDVETFELARVIDQIEQLTQIPRLALAREALQTPELVRRPWPQGLELLFALLLAFTRLRAISLWSIGAGSTVVHLCHAGEFEAPIGPPRELARRILESGELELHEDPDQHALTLGAFGRSQLALVAEGGHSRAAADLREFARVAAPTVLALLDLQERSDTASDDGRASASAERRLRRLRFDLHDGPQQDVILLAEDLRLFRAQLSSATRNYPGNFRLLGALDDLQARLVALAGDLRRISTSVESPTLHTGALPDAVAQAADDFTARTGIKPTLEMQGDFTPITDSQQITLLALVREALNNIREHSDAKRVTVNLIATEAGTEVRIVDDGRGFEPEEELVRAARGGHLGLVGMHERVRMLGGETDIDSRAGGPTTISAQIPRWSGPAERSRGG